MFGEDLDDVTFLRLQIRMLRLMWIDETSDKWMYSNE